jgi:quercetin dioxygenase-like cupin family protein
MSASRSNRGVPVSDPVDLVDLADLQPFAVWGDAVRARKLEGDLVTLAVVELAPGAVVPEHHHRHEQLGMCLRGSVTFTLDDQTRVLGPGGTWRIRSQRPHRVVAGPEGAEVIDVFSPTREDWDFPFEARTTPRWPR